MTAIMVVIILMILTTTMIATTMITTTIHTTHRKFGCRSSDDLILLIRLV